MADLRIEALPPPFLTGSAFAPTVGAVVGVGLGVFVAVIAMRHLAAARRLAALSVDEGSDGFEVVGVDAMTGTAEVVDVQITYRPDQEFVGYAMSPHSPAIDLEFSVPLPVEAGCPFPTITTGVNLAPKPIPYRLIHTHEDTGGV